MAKLRTSKASCSSKPRIKRYKNGAKVCVCTSKSGKLVRLRMSLCKGGTKGVGKTTRRRRRRRRTGALSLSPSGYLPPRVRMGRMGLAPRRTRRRRIRRPSYPRPF